MLKQHKNILFEIIQNSPVPLLGRLESFYEDDLIVDDLGFARNNCFVIHIRNTPLYFWVWPHPNKLDEYHIRHSNFWTNFPLGPWREENKVRSNTRGYRTSTRPYSISDVAMELKYWIINVVSQYFDEEEAEDYWYQLKQYQPFISALTFTGGDFEPFSSGEKSEIRTSLQLFQQLVVQNYNPNEEQLEFIEERLDYLSKAVDRLNRFDWKGVALSTVIGIGINLSVDTNTGANLLRLLERAFQSVRLFLN